MGNFHRGAEMRRVAAIALLAGCGAVYLSAQSDGTQGCAAQGALVPVLVANSGPKVTFQCERATPLDLIRAVGRQTRIPLGVILGSDPDALSKSIRSFDLEQVDAKFALLKAIQDTGYSLKEENQVIVLTAGDLSSRQRSLLALRYSIPRPTHKTSMIELSFDLTMRMRNAMDPDSKYGFGASISTSSNEEQFTLEEALAGTTEQMANKIVSLGSKGMWILKSDPPPPSGALTDQLVIQPYQHYSNRPNLGR
jgi:hypothetical protein